MKADAMSAKSPTDTALRVADLPQNGSFAFELTPDTALRKAIAEELDLSEVRKLRFVGDIKGVGRHDWELNGALGATVVQPCSVTLEPVTTRIDAPVKRLFLRDYESPDEEEAEMDGDDTVEALGTYIDPAAIMIEALSLEVPDYPRSPDAELGEAVYAEGDVKPMTDADARPFAALAALRDQLDDDPSADD